MRLLLIATAIWTVAGATGWAEVLDTSQVPADSKWFIHADVDAMVAGKLPRTIGELWRRLPNAPLVLNQLQRMGGLDPGQDLHGVTMYGRHYAEKSGIVVMHADVDQQRLTRFLRRQPGYRTSRHAGHRLIHWTQKRGTPEEHQATVCCYQPTLLVIGREVDGVKQAIDVLRGTSPHVTDDTHQLVSASATGTMIQAWAVGLADVRLNFESPLVRKSKTVFAVAGERGQEFFAVVKVVTESEDTTEQLRAVAQGLLAMAKLQYDTNDRVTRVLNSVNVSTHDNLLVAECVGSVDEISHLIEQLWACYDTYQPTTSAGWPIA